MNKNFIAGMLTLLFWGLSSNLNAQEATDFSEKKKNTFSIGINYASDGSFYSNSCFYKNEFTRSLNKYFDISAGIGFLSSADSMTIAIGLQPNTITGHSSFSIVSFDFIAHLKVIDFKRHFFKLGIGYSVRKVKSVEFRGAISHSLAYEVNVPLYKNINGFDGGVLANFEYGFRLTPNFSTSINARYYSEGKYVSLAMAGVNLSYSF